MNKTMKLVSVLVMVVMLTVAFSTVSFGSTELIDSVGSSGSEVGTEAIKNIGGTIFRTIRNIAAVLLVVLIAILGVKFMMGSTEEKAEYKKSFIPLIVGVALVLAATTLGGFIWDTFDNVDGSADVVTVAKL